VKPGVGRPYIERLSGGRQGGNMANDPFEQEKRFLFVHAATLLVPLIPVVLLYWMFSQQNFSKLDLVNQGIQLGGPIAAYYILYRTSRKLADRALPTVRERMATLSDPELANLLLEFDSAAFRTPFELEESYMAFERRLEAVREQLSTKLQYVDPRLRPQFRELFDMLNAVIQAARSERYYIPFSAGALLIDAIRLKLLRTANQLLRVFGYPQSIDISRLVTGGVALHPTWRSQREEKVPEAKDLAVKHGLPPSIVDEYMVALAQ
jgi:hypothetical protein